MSNFALGDIHGRYNAFVDVVDKSGFNREKDTLICLGDIVDGGRDTKKCIDCLLGIKNRVYTIGNHCLWCLNWFLTGEELPIWVHQGGYATMESYGYDHHKVPQTHIDLLQQALPYYIDDQNRCYVHGGFHPDIPINLQELDVLIWDRDLINYARHHRIEQFKHVFVGHTSTEMYGTVMPCTANNLTMLDTGAGWKGRLTIMNVDTFEFWQSSKQRANVISESEYNARKFYNGKLDR
jgi:serine/threonine protein phosphatase 1